MNKKQLYESIMASVAREVKKAINEDVNYDEEKQYSNYDMIPKQYRDDEHYHILFDKMSEDDIKKFIENMNWVDKSDPDYNIIDDFTVNNITYNGYKFNSQFAYDGCDLYIAIPYLQDTYINISAEFDWDIDDYDPGDYWTAPSGRSGEIAHSKITSITLYYLNNQYYFDRKNNLQLYEVVEDKILDYLNDKAEEHFDYDEYIYDIRDRYSDYEYDD